MKTSALHPERPPNGPRLARGNLRRGRAAALAATVGTVALAGGCAAVQSPSAAAPGKPLPAAATPTAAATSQPVVTAAQSRAAAPPAWPTGPRTRPAGSYGFLTAIHLGEHASYDRIVFQFTSDIPGYKVSYVPQVYYDAKGTRVSLAGRAYLRVVFNDGSEFLLTGKRSYHGPDTLSPYFPALRQVKLAGDFEGYLSFGTGLSKRTGFRVFTLTHPDRVVIDVAH
jgi:hypothetical protein